MTSCITTIRIICIVKTGIKEMEELIMADKMLVKESIKMLDFQEYVSNETRTLISFILTFCKIVHLQVDKSVESCKMIMIKSVKSER